MEHNVAKNTIKITPTEGFGRDDGLGWLLSIDDVM